jgi:UDPglucose 6-dehydrogenase
VGCTDKDTSLVGELSRGHVRLAEPGLAQLVISGLAAGSLSFTTDTRAAAAHAEAVLLCLPTPPGPGGAPDFSALELVVSEIADALAPGSVLITKSTVLPGTTARLRRLLGRRDVAMASNPEFLREGHAVGDFLRPDRIVIGADSETAVQQVARLYRAWSAPRVLTATASAEMAKYAANCFLAIKLSYVNEIAGQCELFGADVGEVCAVMGYDRRIGSDCLRPGPGWGGPCMPKDVRALLHATYTAGAESPLLRAALTSNEQQHRRVVAKIREAVGGDLSGKHVALLGLTFKAGTNDVRDSPALAVAALLKAESARLTGYDHAVRDDLPGIVVADDPYDAVAHAAAVVVLTEWPQFQALCWTRVCQLMDGDVVIDARQCLEPGVLHQAGLRQVAIGLRHQRGLTENGCRSAFAQVLTGAGLR